MTDVMLTKNVKTELRKHHANQEAFEVLVKDLMKLTETQSAAVTMKPHSASNKVKAAGGYHIFLDYKQEVVR
jgi:hypothetical protein